MTDYPAHKEKLLKLSLQDGRIVSVHEVANGLKCECTCPCCGQKLVAKNNPSNKKAAHFAHYNGVECSGAIESALHKLAKEILFLERMLCLPAFSKNIPEGENTFRHKTYSKERVVTFEYVEIEKRVQIKDDIIIADAVGLYKERQLLIEFAKTHFIDEAKEDKIRKSDFACVEIDISELVQDREQVREVLVKGLNNIHWINNPLGEEAFRKDIEAYKKKKAEEEAHAKQKQEEEDARVKRKQEEEKRALEQRVQEYKNRKYYFIKKKENRSFYCPGRKLIKDGFAQTNYGKHEIIQMILKGNKWNGKFYGGYFDSFSEKHIYVGDKMIEVYPVFMEDEEQRKRDFLYKCLMKYKAYKELITAEPCKYCSFFKEKVHGETVCAFKVNVGDTGLKFYDYEAMESGVGRGGYWNEWEEGW